MEKEAIGSTEGDLVLQYEPSSWAKEEFKERLYGTYAKHLACQKMVLKIVSFFSIKLYGEYLLILVCGR